MYSEVAFSNVVTIALLNDCNMSCAHCYREISSDHYRLNSKQIEILVKDDLLFFQQFHKDILRVYLTGGEVLLWNEDNKNVMDLLLMISKTLKIVPAFDSNGIVFSKKDICFRYLDQYFTKSDHGLKLCLSIDTFHNGEISQANNWLEHKALNNIIEYKKNLKSDKPLYFEVNWVVSTEKGTEIPDDFVDYLKNNEVKLSIIPLLAQGRGRLLSGVMPRLAILSKEDTYLNNKSTLGIYKKYLQKEMNISEQEFEKIPNIEIFKKFNICGCFPIPIFFWKNNYYYCLSQCDRQSSKLEIASIGKLKEGIAKFSESLEAKILKKIQRLGIINFIIESGYLDLCKDILQNEHPLRYIGCSICKDIFKRLLETTDQNYNKLFL